MPITYSFDQKDRLIHTRITGELTLALTEDYFSRLLQDANCPEGASEIIDLSDVTDFALVYEEMENVTQKYQRAKTLKDIRATVFNCASDLSYGIARMLKTAHEITNEKHRVIITRSQEEMDQCMDELRFIRND